MTKFFFDARFIRIDRHDGISRFSAEIFAAVSRLTDVTAIIYDERQLQHLPADTKFVQLSHPEAMKEFLIARKLNQLGATHVFSPMQVMGSWQRKYRLVLTVHDLIYYSHRTPPQDLNPLLQLTWRLYHLTYWPQRFLLNRADAIATVSKTSKSTIAKHRLTKREVAVIYNAASFEAATSQRQYSDAKKKLIYVGSFMPYKNVETLIKAAGQLPDFELHLLSKITDARCAQLLHLAESVGATVAFAGGVPDEQYQDALDSAFALVSASKDEGFGIPLVEAMLRGTPVIASDIEIFREIGGQAASYFDPNSSESLAAAVRAIDLAEAWQAASERSKSQAEKFNWSSSAKALLTLMQLPSKL